VDFLSDPALKVAAAVGEWIIEAKKRRRDEGYFQFRLRCHAHSRYDIRNEHIG